MTASPRDPERTTGQTTIAPTVLLTITRLATLAVPGVRRFAPVPGGVNRLVRRGRSQGIRLNVEDGSVTIELHLVLAPDSNVRQVCRHVQAEVARAIEETVGMPVARIDVHVEDIDDGAAVG